jgi:Short C-terminal domain
VLFLYRPRETWMPFARPMSRTDQAAYNRQLQARFASTRRVPAALPAPVPHDTVTALKELGALHQSGQLTDAEFAQAKAKVLAP